MTYVMTYIMTFIGLTFFIELLQYDSVSSLR